jgi:hypothetical protein
LSSERRPQLANLLPDLFIYVWHAVRLIVL